MTTIVDLDEQIERASMRMELGKPLEDAFPMNWSGRSYSFSTNLLKHGLNWMWLQAHKGLSRQETVATIVPIIRRSLAYCSTLKVDWGRDNHDFVLLNLVILVGDTDLIQETLSLVSSADATEEKPNWWRAHTGILKCRMMGEPEQAKVQYDIMDRCKGKPASFRTASKPLLRSFIAGDPKPMSRQLKTVYELYWKSLQQHMNLPVLYRDDCRIKLGLWDDIRFWPWPEAAILKLVAREGAQFKTDEIWLPSSLIVA